MSVTLPEISAAADAAVPCPGCGYDLRGATSGRCPECGLELDVAKLGESGFPWAHRGKVGRVRAYVRTVLLVTLAFRRFRYEAARPQDERDGRAFRRATGVLAGLAVSAAMFVVLWRLGAAGWGGFPIVSVLTSSAPASRWIVDLLHPWTAGAALLPVLPICAFGFVYVLAGLQRHVVRGSWAEGRVRAARTVAGYAGAPLAFMPLAVAYAFAVGFMAVSENLPPGSAGSWMILSAYFAVLLPPIVSFVRATFWFAWACHAGAVRTIGAAVELAGLWLASALVWLILLPWCVGFVRVVLDGLG